MGRNVATIAFCGYNTDMAKATENRNLYLRAVEAGVAAAKAHSPTPMLVGHPTSILGSDIDPRKPMYRVSGGVCGFAWVSIYPGNSSFARWLVKQRKARTWYQGGVRMNVMDYGQSMTTNEAYAEAFAKVLRENGVTAYADSRMD